MKKPGTRHKARKRAVDLLFEAEARGITAAEGAKLRNAIADSDPEVSVLNPYTVTVELLVSHTEPGLQGDRSSAGTKPATLETGAEIQVPLFINTGDKLKVDSRDGSYLGRVNS